MKIRFFYILILCLTFNLFAIDIEYTDENNFEVLIRETEKSAGLHITTKPEEAEIYINSTFRGISNLFLADSAPGEYKVLIKKTGFEDTQTTIIYKRNTYTKISCELKPAKGFLEVQSTVDNIEGSAGLFKITKGINELPEGYYNLRLKAFGYKDISQKIKIEKNKTTFITAEFVKDSFRISRLKINRKLFNPENSGSLGLCTIFFETSSPGKGRITIFSKENIIVLSKALEDFNKLDQIFKWDGKAENGIKLPEGQYRILVEGESSEGESSSSESFIEISYKNKMHYRTIWNGTRGFMYCPDTETLEQGSFEFSSLTMGHFEADDFYSFPTAEAISFSVLNNLETSIFAGVEIKNENENPVFAGTSLKYRFINTEHFQTALIGKFNYKTGKEEKNVFANDSGGALALAGSLRFGFLGIAVSPELSVNTWKDSYYYDVDDEDIYMWLNTRAALFADFKYISTAVSGSCKTGNAYTSDFDVIYPYAAAWEINVLVPGTSLNISAALGSEFKDSDDFYLMGGFGIGFIY